MTAGAPCRILDWDSEFFGLRIARYTGTRLDPTSWGDARRWCSENSVDCLYLLTEAMHGPTHETAHAAGLRFVDVRLTFERPVGGEVGLPEGIRPATPADVAPLAAIARESHRDTRFYFDPRFDGPTCDALYAKWIENSCTGFADEVLVAEADDGPGGYITCHRNDDGSGQIGLVAVDGRARGRGLGALLVRGHLAWCATLGLGRAVVVTQGRNVPAARMYEKRGYVTRSVELWYHYWPADHPPGDRP